MGGNSKPARASNSTYIVTQVRAPQIPANPEEEKKTHEKITKNTKQFLRPKVEKKTNANLKKAHR